MPIQVYAPLNDEFRYGNFTITDDGQYTYKSDAEISTQDVLSITNEFIGNNVPKYQRLQRYYRGQHDIYNQAPKDSYKPDNKLIINFPRKAVTDFNGFFIGNMVKIDSPDDNVDKTIAQWQNENNFEDVLLEVSKQASEYGHSFFYVYQDEKGDTKVTVSSVQNTFLIYDDTPAKDVKYAIQFSETVEGQLVITLYDNNYIRTFTQTSGNGGLTMIDSIINPYGCIPVIEVLENSDRMALCQDTLSLIDALNKAMSEKTNDVDYFADAYLKMINVEIDEDSMKDFRKNRMINVTGSPNYGDPDIGFIQKPSSDETQEHLIDRLINSIYSIAGITNINDESFGGNPTGVALQMKFKPMQNMAKAKSLKLKKSLRQVFQCVFAVDDSTPDDAWNELTFKFSQNVPTNTGEIANLINVAFGKLPLRLLYSQIPWIDDPDKAVEEFKEEQAENQSDVKGLMTNQTDNGDE